MAADPDAMTRWRTSHDPPMVSVSSLQTAHRVDVHDHGGSCTRDCRFVVHARTCRLLTARTLRRQRPHFVSRVRILGRTNRRSHRKLDWVMSELEISIYIVIVVLCYGFFVYAMGYKK